MAGTIVVSFYLPSIVEIYEQYDAEGRQTKIEAETKSGLSIRNERSSRVSV